MTQKYAPIIRYDWDCRKMKKDEWRRYERRIYEQAVVFTRSTGTRILIVDNGPQGSRRLSENDNWSEYHITLERQPASATASNHANHCRCSNTDKGNTHGPSREAPASGRPQQRTQNVPQNPPPPE